VTVAEPIKVVDRAGTVGPVTGQWMIYGSNGYTGQLVARLAVRRGERPILAGRSGGPVRQLAAELGLPSRVVALTDRRGLRDALRGVAVVAHVAGPFEATADRMVQACLQTGTHYLDVNGEVAVFERIYARHEAARDGGVVLLPGCGFDVVPTDCLAATLAAALPGAVALDLAFLAGGGVSRGTLRVALRMLGAGNLRRIDGRLRPTPLGVPWRVVPFPSGPRQVGAIRYGDLASAYRSTGIPTITVYTLGPRQGGPVGLTLALAARPLLRWDASRWLVERATGWLTGPTPDRRARSRCEVWAEVRDRDGATRTATLVGPNAYELTADALLRGVRHLLAGAGPAGPIAPGAHTPSSAFGAGFVRDLDGVEMSPVRGGTTPQGRIGGP
jgi:saccharopine dehydrogenase (NAD+, L-lysine-forming)